MIPSQLLARRFICCLRQKPAYAINRAVRITWSSGSIMFLFHLHANQRRPCELGSSSKCNQKLFHLWTEFTPPYLFSCKCPHQKTDFQRVSDAPEGIQGGRSP